MAGHIFLTGEKQVGKSTAIRRFLAHWPGGVDGFCTVSEFRDGDRVLYMTAADGSRQAPVAVLAPGAPRRLEHPEAFEELGAALLAGSGGPGKITLMDEIGFLEAGLPRFSAAVLARLDRPGPVLGVLREDDNPLLRAVAAHPSVTVVRVTKTNRDGLPARLLERFTGDERGGRL